MVRDERLVPISGRGMRWWRLPSIAAGIAIVSLSIHVAMLQGLHVPYPDMRGVGRLGLILVLSQTLAVMIVYRLARASIASLSIVAQVGIVCLGSTMIQGQIRSAVMEGVVTTSFAFPMIGLAAQLASNLLLAVLAVAAVRLVRSAVLLVPIAAVVTAIMVLLVGPQIGKIVGTFVHLSRPPVFTPPYGSGVLAVSYAIFVEPVVAAIAIASLVRGRLSRHPSRALLEFVALILLLRGTLVMQILFPWAMTSGWLAGSLSASQFFLQDLVMALLVWLVCARSRRAGIAS